MDLQVDVNGDHTFFVDKEILCSFSTKFRGTKMSKLVLPDLPGGPEAFELVVKYCYNNGEIVLTPTNSCVLHCAARFMEMARLVEETEKLLEGITYWSWSEIVNSLKKCSDFFLVGNSVWVLEKLLDSLVARIMAPVDTSPSGSSPDSSGFRFSFDTRSTVSTKNGLSRSWWFEDLTCFDSRVVEKATRIMMSRKFDHVSISRFLFYYLKVRATDSAPEEKRKAIETVIDLLHSLDYVSVSCRSLLWILRVSSSINMSAHCRTKLESMIGIRIDQVTLDNLLVPARAGTESLYDVDLVLRFLKSFLTSEGRHEIHRLRKLGSLMDLYLAEVAPDSSLKYSRFLALTTALPDIARGSHDAMYRAIDIYLEVHGRLSEEEKMKICFGLNYEKLSIDSCKNLASNTKFPSRTAIQALLSQQTKLKSLLQETNNISSFHKDQEHVVLYAKKLDLSTENNRLRANLQGMQCRVMQLEKVFRNMQGQMTKMTKTTKTVSHSGSRSLPKLCS